LNRYSRITICSVTSYEEQRYGAGALEGFANILWNLFNNPLHPGSSNLTTEIIRQLEKYLSEVNPTKILGVEKELLKICVNPLLRRCLKQN
jgi:hypothetical protein